MQSRFSVGVAGTHPMLLPTFCTGKLAPRAGAVANPHTAMWDQGTLTTRLNAHSHEVHEKQAHNCWISEFIRSGSVTKAQGMTKVAHDVTHKAILLVLLGAAQCLPSPRKCFMHRLKINPAQTAQESRSSQIPNTHIQKHLHSRLVVMTSAVADIRNDI